MAITVMEVTNLLFETNKRYFCLKLKILGVFC